MICLERDISGLTEEYINNKQRYNQVINELEGLIDLDLHVKYLSSFDAIKNENIKHNELIDLANKIMNTQKKTKWLHNWPTKPPGFTTIRNQVVMKGKRDNYSLRFGPNSYWKLKRYPPNKEFYIIVPIRLKKPRRTVPAPDRGNPVRATCRSLAPDFDRSWLHYYSESGRNERETR
jgi:hypothetical protein